VAGHDGLDDRESHSGAAGVAAGGEEGVEDLFPIRLAFDGAQFYRIFACASEAFAQGRLDAATLRDSETRLRGAVPVD
jgi:hypothetical protein